MANAEDLMGVGVSSPEAELEGFVNGSATGAGTTTGAATVLPLGVSHFALITAGGADAVRLNGSFPQNKFLIIHNLSATTAQVFPSSGAVINGGGTDAAVNIAQNFARIFVRRSNLFWWSWITA